MPFYAGFFPEDAEIVSVALEFVRSRIEQFFDNLLSKVDKFHHQPIINEMNRELVKLNFVVEFIKKHADIGVFQMDEKTHSVMMNIIRSCLEIYSRDLRKVSELGIGDYDERIGKIDRMFTWQGLKNAEVDLFDKYCPPTASAEEKELKFFISYSTKDKELAGKIRSFLGDRVDVFLAHHDIEVSREWREEIHQHLESCNLLLALLTPNFKNSVWANQETGYALAKQVKVIPLIVEGTDIKEFGFLEELQGVPVKEDNLKEAIDKILRISVSEPTSLA